jgi:hypothetical protein
MLANETPVRLNNVLKNPKLAEHHLRTEFLPKGWTPESEAELTPSLLPDSHEASEAAETEAKRDEKAGQAWSRLSPDLRQNLLQAVKQLTPDSGAEADLDRALQSAVPL